MKLVRRVALVRAINVGGHVVRMAGLRAHFESLGFDNVSTVIASGNVVFDASAKRAATRAKLEGEITQSLSEWLGFPADTFVRTPEELQAISTRTPLDDAYGADAANTLYVNFLRDEQDLVATQRIAALCNDVDQLVLDGLELYWLQRRALGESRIKPAQLGAVIKGPVTSRNITSVRRIHRATAEARGRS